MISAIQSNPIEFQLKINFRLRTEIQFECHIIRLRQCQIISIEYDDVLKHLTGINLRESSHGWIGFQFTMHYFDYLNFQNENLFIRKCFELRMSFSLLRPIHRMDVAMLPESINFINNLITCIVKRTEIRPNTDAHFNDACARALSPRIAYQLHWLVFANTHSRQIFTIEIRKSKILSSDRIESERRERERERILHYFRVFVRCTMGLNLYSIKSYGARLVWSLHSKNDDGVSQ